MLTEELKICLTRSIVESDVLFPPANHQKVCSKLNLSEGSDALEKSYVKVGTEIAEEENTLSK
jgi:hypothetical protein